MHLSNTHTILHELFIYFARAPCLSASYLSEHRLDDGVKRWLVLGQGRAQPLARPAVRVADRCAGRWGVRGAEAGWGARSEPLLSAAGLEQEGGVVLVLVVSGRWGLPALMTTARDYDMCRDITIYKQCNSLLNEGKLFLSITFVHTL